MFFMFSYQNYEIQFHKVNFNMDILYNMVENIISICHKMSV